MLPSVSCKVLSQENGGSVGSGKFPGGFSTRSRSSLISLLNFDTRTTETLLLLFRDPAEALLAELSIVSTLVGAGKETEGIGVFENGPAIDRTLTAGLSCPSEGRGKDHA